MAFDARKAWIKRRVTSALQLVDPSIWDSMITKDNRKAERELEHFLDEATAGAALFFTLKTCDSPQTKTLNLRTCESKGLSDMDVQLYVLKMCAGPINLAGKAKEMNRCILLSSIGPRVLDDLALILSGLVVPSLQDCLKSSGDGESEQSNAAIPAEFVAAASKATPAQVLAADKQLWPAASSDSQLAESESADGNDVDGTEGSKASQPWSRQESAQIIEECDDVSPVKDADVPDPCPEEGQLVEPDIASSESFTVDPARAAETLGATLELLNQIATTSTTMTAPLPMPSANDATDDSPETINSLEDIVSQWQELTYALLEAEQKRKAESCSPLSEITFWRDRHTAVSSLYEQFRIPASQQVLQQLKQSRPQSNTLAMFEKTVNALEEMHVEALSNVRFLSTLERYFKNLESSPLKALSDTVGALMDALRMMWVTSRQFTSDERMQGLMEKIAHQLEVRVRQEVRMKELLKGDLDESITVLQRSRELLEAWKSEYFNMRTLLEESVCNRRWEFDRRKLFQRTDYVASVCLRLEEVAKTIQQFKRFIRPKLRSVTRSRRALNRLTCKLQALIRSFDSFSSDIFDERNAAEVVNTVKEFKRQTDELENDCAVFLDTKFTRLRSALSAFKMLKDFTTTASRPKINAKLDEKFVNILQNFNLEVDHMRVIFERGRDNPLIPSHMPPISGSILWSSRLLQALKTSVLAFKQLPEAFDGSQAEIVFGNYLAFAKSITAYQKNLVKQWQQVDAAAAASESLKAYILRQEANGTYAVNFRPELWVFMQEARHLNQLGVHEAPVAVLNVALHKERFYQHYVLLESLVEKLNCTISNTLPAYKNLLSRQIAELHRAALPGLTTLNWTSLGLEDFVASCLKALTVFKATCEQVFKNVKAIEQIVKEIESSQLIRDINWDSFEPFNIQDYYDYFENHRAREVEKLRSRYEAITSYLKKVEELLEGRTTGSSEAMSSYYLYWERRIFNAIAIMLIKGKPRALRLYLGIQWTTSRFRAFFSSSPSACRWPAIIRVTTELNEKEVIIHGSTQAIFKTISKLMQNIIASSMSFSRWMNGTCKCVPTDQLPADEAAAVQFTFYNELSRLPALINSTVATHQAIQKAFQHITKYIRNWSKYEDEWALWNPNRKAELDALLVKKPSLVYFDVFVRAYDKLAAELACINGIKTIGFIQLDSSAVIDGIRKQALVLSKVYADKLHQIAMREKADLDMLILHKREHLEMEADSLDTFKLLMESVTTVSEISMDTEIRLTELQEIYSTLLSYSYFVTGDEKQEIGKLPGAWKDLRNLAHRRKRQLMHCPQVSDFMAECKALQQRFEAGPASVETKLEEGLEAVTDLQEEIAAFKRRAADLNSAENLFSLPISRFPVLERLDQDVIELQKVYALYADHDSSVKEWAGQLWTKVDFQELQKAAEEFGQRLKQLAKEGGPRVTNAPAYRNVEHLINSFRSELSLIERLKNEAIRPQHWKELMCVAGKVFDAENKNFRLQDVLNLELARFPDAISEIIQAANEEMKLEKDVAKIESCWRQQTVEIANYKNDSSRFVLRSNDKLKMLLDDNLLQLQSMLGSRFAAAMMEKIRKWEKSLNIIREVLDAWLQVQRKWMYLDGIFTNSIDVRLQLPEEAKKFDTINRRFLSIMKQTSENPNVLSAFCLENRQGEMKELATDLDSCQRSLSDYLDTKRIIYPRFYFISDGELLSVLGSTGHEAVQPLMLKLFDNCKFLQVNASGQVSGMESEEGEIYHFLEAVVPEGPAEEWMTLVDEAMNASLHGITKDGVFLYGCKPRKQWVTEQLGMVTCVASRIWWTWRVEDAFDRMEKGEKNALREEAAVQRQQARVDTLIEVVRKPLEPKARKKVNTLVILDVHARDLVERFVQNTVFSSSSFDWESQLRFYWDAAIGDVEVRQCNGKFRYGYEYQGLNGHLVITPLTDRCIMTLTTALTFFLGGAPAGPAGTGKTETVKDLAKSLATRCVVQNCGEGLDYKAMGTIFSGLVQTGFWGCFDEFNRINPEVLSVVSAQIKAIQTSLQNGKGSVELLGKSLKFIPTTGIFVTMNPGYAGRSELPENLKAMFRPATMTIPDMAMICEIMLISEGFRESRVLARKLTVLYRLAQAQLSKQYFYDFQLRALKAVLVTAGSMKRTAPESSDTVLLMRALRDMNIPKLIKPDVPLFLGLLSDLFPGVSCERVALPSFQEAVQLELQSKGFKSRHKREFETQVDKVVQLHQTMETRHSTMVVGPTGGGKTVIIEALATAYKKVFEETVKMFPINPKAQGTNELYGVLDPISRDWTDGLLSKIFRDANQALVGGRREKRFILFDGDVDAAWVENMNSVMDDNKILTLPNGERIRLEKHCALLFEVSDLRYASPATVSRCGMVYVDQRDLGSGPYYDCWARSKSSEALLSVLDYLWEKYVPQCLTFLFQEKGREDELHPPAQCVHRSDVSMVAQLCNLIDIMIPDLTDVEAVADKVENAFLFALVWSLGATLKGQERERFDKLLRTLSGKAATFPNFFDSIYDVNSSTWLTWDKQIPPFSPEKGTAFTSIFVPTTDTVRFLWLLQGFASKALSTLFIGESGTAKSMMIESWLNALNSEEFLQLQINFSSRTTSLDFQKALEDSIDKRIGRVYGPPSGKVLKVFLDDLNMPTVDTYGTQQPVALLRFVMERMFLYERGRDLEKIILKDVHFLGAMNPPGNGRNFVDPRAISRFRCFNINEPSRESVKRILSNILQMKFGDDGAALQESITTRNFGTLYESVLETMTRTPKKFHYIFNMRDLSRIFQGIWHANLPAAATEKTVVRLWRHECLRVFQDRLMDQEEKDYLQHKQIKDIIEELFPDVSEFALKDPIIWTDFQSALQQLERNEIADSLEVRQLLERLLELHNCDNKPMNLVMFEDAIAHIARVHRIIRMDRGHALLIGVGGSGKRSVATLAIFAAGYNQFCLTPMRAYGEAELREDLRTLITLAARGRQCLLFSDADVKRECFLEYLNNLLTVGTVPALFADDQKEALIATIRESAKADGAREDSLWSYATSRATDNLHVILAMSPSGNSLRDRCRSFPGLISCTNVDWFQPWSVSALAAVANVLLQNEDLQPYRSLIQEHAVEVHSSVTDVYAPNFERKFGRVTFATPKNYIDFLKTYKGMLRAKRHSVDQLSSRLEGGLQKMNKAAESVKIMNAQVEAKKGVIDERKRTIEALISNINEKSTKASKRREEARATERQISQDQAIINQEKASADKALTAAIPTLEAAARALENLDKKDITEIKAFMTPPKPVMNVCMCVVVLRPLGRENEADGWNGAKAMLNDVNFLKSLIEYPKDNITERQVRKISEYFNKDPDSFTNEKMAKISKAGNGLLAWVKAMIEYHEVAKGVEPKRKLVAELQQKQEEAERNLSETREELFQLEGQLATLMADQKEQMAILSEVEAEARVMERRLIAAYKLIDGLESERHRWTEERMACSVARLRLVGSCLVGAAFLSYAGPYTLEFRTQMLYKHWATKAREGHIPINEPFKIEGLLTTDADVAKWSREGLPANEMSIQNGILTTMSSRWPLCIDPQLQALKWIKQREEGHGLVLKTFADDYMKHLELAIQYGKPFLFVSVETEVDPSIDPVLERNLVIQNGQKIITLLGKPTDWNDSFCLYMTSKLSNPNFSPEVMNKTNVINYQVTITGLAEQMLAIVVANEVPDLENQRQELLQRMSEGRLMLKQLENTLLYELAHFKGSPLDNEDLIETLQNTKTKALEIEQFLGEAKMTSAQIEEKRQDFYCVAKRGSICYFSMDGMRNLSPMLEYSLDAFMHIFQVALREARQDRILENRLKSLCDKVTQLSYDYVSLGLFENQRLIFAFHLTTMIMRHDGKLSEEELEFFLRGSTSISANQPRPKQLSWLSESGWNDLCKIGTVNSNFKGLKDSVVENSRAWQRWAHTDSAEKADMPGQWSQVVSPFQKLIIMRAFRVDRVHNAIKQFIQGRLNEHYVQAPTLQYSKIYAQSSELSPILLILSPGANPHAAVSALADAVGLPANKFRFLSIGQGMGEQAQQLVEAGYQRGFWIMLQNCHLLPAWLEKLAKLLQDMKKPHAGFRLWLTSQPADVFPLSILQASLKVVTEPPDGLRANMQSSYSLLREDAFDHCNHSAYPSLVYTLSFFHAVVQERRKYGKMGWNIPYDFNESDLSISISLAKTYLDKSSSPSEGADKNTDSQDPSLLSNESDIPWETLRYLIGEAVYGGRVTDDYDRRVLETYLDEYLGEFLLDTYRQFSFYSRETGYTLPSDDTFTGHIEFIKSMPTSSSPEVFGLHSNAQIGYFVDNAKLIWHGLLKINRSSASGNRNESASRDLKQDTLVETLSDILEKLPKKDLYYAAESDALSPTQVVLAQELDRLNRLVEKVSQSLHDLSHALHGDIGMSAELDELSSAIQTGFVPAQWRAFAPPSCKPLGSWVAHLLRRVIQYTKWMEEGSLISYWLGGLHVPDSLLTAIIQQTSHKKGLALDKLVLLSEVTDLVSCANIADPLEYGAYVEGMYIEGARWDATSRCLASQHPRKLFEELPLVKVVPVESHRLDVRNLLRTPVYATQARRNPMGEGWVFDAWLPYSEHGSFWILTGTAIVLETND
ncbi:hypothetical protein Esti_001870 [Eimeria stiedai]